MEFRALLIARSTFTHKRKPVASPRIEALYSNMTIRGQVKSLSNLHRKLAAGKDGKPDQLSSIEDDGETNGDNEPNEGDEDGEEDTSTEGDQDGDGALSSEVEQDGAEETPHGVDLGGEEDTPEETPDGVDLDGEEDTPGGDVDGEGTPVVEEHPSGGDVDGEGTPVVEDHLSGGVIELGKIVDVHYIIGVPPTTGKQQSGAAYVSDLAQSMDLLATEVGEQTGLDIELSAIDSILATGKSKDCFPR
jgi:hypothetical protein